MFGSNRSTPDLIVIWLSIVVGFVVVITAITSVIGVMVGQTDAVDQMLSQVGQLVQALIAVIVGYVGGRGAAMEKKSNGKGPTPPPPG